MLKPLAEVLGTSVTELLGLEEEEQKVELVTAVAAEETARLRKEIRQRAFICLVSGVLWLVTQQVIANVLNRMGIYDRTIQVCTIGMSGFAGTLIGNSLWLWWKHRK